MKIFFVRTTSIFILLLIAYLSSSAQPCKVTITGNTRNSGHNCSPDTLNANFTGGILSNLVWTWSYKDSDEYGPASTYFSANFQTVAGGNDSGSAPNQLNNPTAVFADANGNIYVADAANNRIQKWAPGATSGVTVAGGNGEGDAAYQLSSPEGVFVDAHGNIYVADRLNWRVQKWAPGATSGITVAGGNGFGSAANQLFPAGVFVDGSGNIYAADEANCRIQKWKPGAKIGTTVAGGNGYGSAPNQLAYPKSIYVDSGKNIYIADSYNHRIQKWKSGAASGTTVAGGNGNGSADNQLSAPAGVCMNGSGDLFIADTYNNRIQKWEKGGVTGTTIDPGFANPFSEPYSVSIDADGNIYVADKNNNRVQEYLSQVTNTKLIPDLPWGTYTAIATSSTGCIDTSNKISVYACGPDLCDGEPTWNSIFAPVLTMKGRAPAPWAIDGSVDDWETILGPVRYDPSHPFCPRSDIYNWSLDGFPSPDLDKPDSTRDISFSAFIPDDYNVYFYFHRLKAGNLQNTFFYFLDVNADGYMNYGEPVLQAVFSRNSISALSISSYIPDTTKFYVAGKGNDMVPSDPDYWAPNFLRVDSFPLPGHLKKLFSSDSIPMDQRLTAKEIFSAAVTENGYGVELAVPWKYLKNWAAYNRFTSKRNRVFTFKMELQKGMGNYHAARIADNVGSPCNSFVRVGNEDLKSSVSVETLDPGSYRFKIKCINPTNAAERVFMEGITMSQIDFTSQGIVRIGDLKAGVSRDINCSGFLYDGVSYSASGPGDSLLAHGGTVDFGPYPNEAINLIIPAFDSCYFIADVYMPDNMSLVSGSFLFQSSAYFLFQNSAFKLISEPCDASGRVINPVGSAKTKVVNKKFSLNVSENNISVDKTISDNDVKVYPNPNDGTAIVSLPVDKGITNAVLYDMYGNILQNWNNVDLHKIHITGLTSGSYFLKVNFQDGKTVTKKIIVNK